MSELTEQFTKQHFIAMWRAAKLAIDAKHESLSQLDATTGDGDHGDSILRAMNAIEMTVVTYANLPLGKLASQMAINVMMCDGGSTSPLLGSYFTGFASAAPADELTAEQTIAFFRAALAKFAETSKAKLGDKTMMDALQPATEALCAELQVSGNLQAAFAAAADAAAAGAANTKDYVAHLGRARLMGKRAVGCQDAGATSIMYIFSAFASTVKSKGLT